MSYAYPKKCSAAMIAACFGVTRQAVALWPKNQGAPINPDGTFSLPDIIAWREARLRREAVEEALREADTEEAENTRDPELRRKRAAEATMKEIQVAEKCGLLVRREDVDLHYRRTLNEVRQALEAQPATLARDLENLPALEIAAKLRTQHQHLLKRLQHCLN